MGITYLNRPAVPTAIAPPVAAEPTPEPKKKRGSGHVKPKAPLITLDQPGRLRIANLLALYGRKSPNTLHTWLHLGKIPQPDGYDGKSPYWLTSTIRAHLESSK
ncbi:hypothetical protein [Cupriavidus yeoncheonensis]|uniref:hypothetical protein n=1 Tax=Cupriavidus yeoncheonensis TaxID=1462994 RepID=UPI001BA732E0|nr:hypothetical protein [Cupriavidus yeoncheonensis]